MPCFFPNLSGMAQFTGDNPGKREDSAWLNAVPHCSNYIMLPTLW